MLSLAIRLHAWLRTLPDARLLVALFLLRALLLALPLAVVHFGKFEAAGTTEGLSSHLRSVGFLAYVLLAAPAFEIFLECSIPHLFLKGTVQRRPWVFALTSAALMTAMHPWGAVSVFPFLTGLVLAYCYLLFLQRHSTLMAFASTAGLHAAMNLVGLGVLSALVPP